jgi:hypothetical protein
MPDSNADCLIAAVIVGFRLQNPAHSVCGASESVKNSLSQQHREDLCLWEYSKAHLSSRVVTLGLLFGFVYCESTACLLI